MNPRYFSKADISTNTYQMSITSKTKTMQIASLVLFTYAILIQASFSYGINSESEVKEKILSEPENDNIFVPTNEWKEIKKDQKIPAGLHVRMNLQTGLKEAKLLDEEQENKAISSQQSLIEVPAPEELDTVSEIEDRMRDNIIEALKNIKSEDGKTSEELSNEAKERKNLFRSYKELKADFKELNLNIETDTELLEKLISEYKETNDDQMRLNILEDLDYLAHQVDNAVDFVNMGGLTTIIQPGMNSSSEEIRKSVMRLLGSATQSNPKVQIAALEGGLLSQLLRIIAIEKDSTISSRAVFAVSCIVRGFPYGQQMLIESGGLQTLREVFYKQDWQAISLQLKVVSLLQDLLHEREEAEGDRANQLNKVDLLESLIEGEWCRAIPSLLTAASFDNRNKRIDNNKVTAIRPDHDMVDKVVGTMTKLGPRCRLDFVSELPLLKSLEQMYDDLASEEKLQNDDDQYFQQVANQIKVLVNQVDSFGKEEL